MRLEAKRLVVKMKDLIFKVLKSKFVFAAVLNAVFAAAIIILTSFSYIDSNDYYTSIQICRDHFYYSGTINYILAMIVGTVQYSLPDFNCFVLFQILASYAAFVSITFVFADKYNNRKAFIFSAVLNIIYALNHYSQVSNKSTSALLLLGGFMLVLNAIYHKRYSLSCWLGVAEILFGSFLNYLYFFVALGFAIAFFFGDMLAKRKYRLQFQKFFWYSRPFFLMFLLVTLLTVGLAQFSNSVNHATDEAESYYNYSVAKTSADALPFPDYKEHAEEFKKAGIDTETKYEVFKLGYFDPVKKLDTDALEAVNKIQLEDIKSKPMYALNAVFMDFYKHIQNPDTTLIAMFMYIGISVIFIIYHKNRFSFFPLFYLLAGIITVIVLRMFLFINTPVLYGVLMFMLALLMNSFNFEIQRSDKPSSKLRMSNGYMIISSVAVLIVAAVNCFVFFSSLPVVNYNYVPESLISDINRNPDCYYVMDTPTEKDFVQYTENYLHPMWGFRSEYLENLDGFTYFHNSDMLRRRYLPENIYEAIMTNRKIYVIDKNIVFRKENYLNENYTDKNSYVAYEQVNELDGYKIYEVKQYEK